MDLTLKVFARQDSLQAPAEGVPVDVRANKMGQLVVMDFYTQMAIEGRCYQVRAGTITTPLVGDVIMTDAKCEMSADSPLGTTILPVYANVSLEYMAGTRNQVCAKSVTAITTGGTAFVPLPLLIDGTPAVTAARVTAAGGVTVGAELATTTCRHWTASNSGKNEESAAAGTSDLKWEPRCPPVIEGPASFYIQVSGEGTGPNYFANFDFIEIPTVNLS